MLNSLNNPSPAKRNVMNITSDIPAAFPALIFCPALFKPMMMGVDPVISITAKSTMNAVNISLILILKSIFSILSGTKIRIKMKNLFLAAFVRDYFCCLERDRVVSPFGLMPLEACRFRLKCCGCL